MPSDEEGLKTPVVACVSRLVPQKGIHLIKRAIERTAEKGGAFLLLGSAPQVHIPFSLARLVPGARSARVFSSLSRAIGTRYAR